MKDRVRNALVIVLGEFAGTFMFLLLSFIGAQTALVTNSPSDPTAPLLPFSLMYIAASFGTALAVNVWIFYRVSGGMFNPAVSLGLVLVGAVPPLHALAIIPTQLVAAMAAAGITDALLPGPLLVTNSLSNGTSVAQGVFIEMFLTAQLVLTVYFLAVEKHRSTHLAPIGIGISVFIAHICATNWTGTSINPARSLGPSVVAGFHGYDWIYYVGPFMGSLLAFGCYKIFKALEYQTANPGQDDDDLERAGRHHFFHHGKEPVSHSHTDTIEPKDHGVPQRNDSVIDGQMAPV
jgi:aquaporin related protein